MSSTPPEGGGASAPIPPGYQPGDYIPHADRTPEHPWAIAGQPDTPEPTQARGPVDSYREIYGYDAPDRVTYAGWLSRVGAYLIDSVFSYVAMAPAGVGYFLLLRDATTTIDAAGVETVEFGDPNPAAIGLILIGLVTGIAFWIWNLCLRQGRTGYTLGKTVLGIKLVGTHSQAPIGGGKSFLRQLAHILDGLCYIGYLWPLWDKQKQTFADKIMSTVVIVQAPPSKE